MLLIPSSIFCCFLKQNLQVDELNLPQIGPKFEHHEMFPARTNTGQFVCISSHVVLHLIAVPDHEIRVS